VEIILDQGKGIGQHVHVTICITVGNLKYNHSWMIENLPTLVHIHLLPVIFFSSFILDLSAPIGGGEGEGENRGGEIIR